VNLKAITIPVLLCGALFWVSVLDGGRAAAQTTKSVSQRRQQELVKQINQRAERFYKTFIRENPGTDPLDSELNGHFEDLLLTIDGLANPLYRRQNLILAMQIIAAIERLLLMAYVSAGVVMAWARLHADLDLLARLNGIRWSEAVVTGELIAALVDDVDKFSRALQAEVPQFHGVSLKTSSDLLVVLEDFRHSAQTLNARSPQAVDMRSRIEAVRNHSRLITESLERYSITPALQHDWKRITSQLEELVRLYLLDSVGSIQNLPPLNTLSALFTVHPEARNLQYREAFYD
jgi:hypothetical protein